MVLVRERANLHAWALPGVPEAWSAAGDHVRPGFGGTGEGGSGGPVRTGHFALSDRSVLPVPDAKVEAFWVLVEGQLLAMLEGEEGLTLRNLNEYTMVWMDRLYQRRHHQELGCSPMDRFLQSEHASRDCPSMAE